MHARPAAARAVSRGPGPFMIVISRLLVNGAGVPGGCGMDTSLCVCAVRCGSMQGYAGVQDGVGDVDEDVGEDDSGGRDDDDADDDWQVLVLDRLDGFASQAW